MGDIREGEANADDVVKYIKEREELHNYDCDRVVTLEALLKEALADPLATAWQCDSCDVLRKWLSDERKITDELTKKLESARGSNGGLRAQLRSLGSLEAPVVAKAVYNLPTTEMLFLITIIYLY